MNLLPANELDQMTLTQLVAYKSLLTVISQTKDFPDIDKKIIDRISESISNYQIEYHRELSTAMVPWEDNKKFLDGILESLRQAGEAEELQSKVEAETAQKQALIGELIPTYIEMTYPLPEAISILGKTILKIATKEELAKLVGVDKSSIEKTPGGKRDRSVEITH